MGNPAHLLEVGLLLLAAFLIGAVLGSLARRAFSAPVRRRPTLAKPQFAKAAAVDGIERTIAMAAAAGSEAAVAKTEVMSHAAAEAEPEFIVTVLDQDKVESAGSLGAVTGLPAADDAAATAAIDAEAGPAVSPAAPTEMPQLSDAPDGTVVAGSEAKVTGESEVFGPRQPVAPPRSAEIYVLRPAAQALAGPVTLDGLPPPALRQPRKVTRIPTVPGMAGTAASPVVQIDLPQTAAATAAAAGADGPAKDVVPPEAAEVPVVADTDTVDGAEPMTIEPMQAPEPVAGAEAVEALAPEAEFMWAEPAVASDPAPDVVEVEPVLPSVAGAEEPVPVPEAVVPMTMEPVVAGPALDAEEPEIVAATADPDTAADQVSARVSEAEPKPEEAEAAGRDGSTGTVQKATEPERVAMDEALPETEPVPAELAQPPVPAGDAAFEDDEAAAMRAIEGNWSPRTVTQPRHRAELPEGVSEALVASGAAVNAAVLAARAIVAEAKAPAPEPSAIEADGLATDAPVEVEVPPAEPGRPVGLGAPRGDRKDELTHIIGVLPALEVALNDIGIYHFDQIADWDAENMAWVEDHLGIEGRVRREHWREQARELSASLQPRAAEA